MSDIERIWQTANRKRTAERQAAHDNRITAAIEHGACTVDNYFDGAHGTLCGAPLDDEGQCEMHQ